MQHACLSTSAELHRATYSAVSSPTLSCVRLKKQEQHHRTHPSTYRLRRPPTVYRSGCLFPPSLVCGNPCRPYSASIGQHPVHFVPPQIRHRAGRTSKLISVLGTANMVGVRRVRQTSNAGGRTWDTNSQMLLQVRLRSSSSSSSLLLCFSVILFLRLASNGFWRPCLTFNGCWLDVVYVVWQGGGTRHKI
jgi:hypothetical protein